MRRSNKNGRTVIPVVGIPHESSLITACERQRGKKRLALRPIGTTDQRKTLPRPNRWAETRETCETHETRLTLAAHRSLHRTLACTPTPPAANGRVWWLSRLHPSLNAFARSVRPAWPGQRIASESPTPPRTQPPSYSTVYRRLPLCARYLPEALTEGRERGEGRGGAASLLVHRASRLRARPGRYNHYGEAVVVAVAVALSVSSQGAPRTLTSASGTHARWCPFPAADQFHVPWTSSWLSADGRQRRD